MGENGAPIFSIEANQWEMYLFYQDFWRIIGKSTVAFPSTLLYSGLESSYLMHSSSFLRAVMDNRRIFFCVLQFCAFLCFPATSFACLEAQTQKGKDYAVASAHPLASEAAVQILEAGGNAFDAAIATAAVLAVVEPYSSGLGGGGFWLLQTSDGQRVVLDSREKAPLRASPNMYLDETGEVIDGLSINGGLAAAIPGIPAALDVLAKKYAKLPLETTLKSAISLAQNGFVVNAKYLRYARQREKALRKSPASAQIFLDDGKIPSSGHVVVQKNLAKTLRLLAKNGGEYFYHGAFARKLVEEVNAAGGIWQTDDLEEYTALLRKPMEFTYHDLHIQTVPLPSSGGVGISQILKILETFDLENQAPALREHIIIEAMRRAYHDRSLYLGDPDVVPIPLQRIQSQAYIRKLAATISTHVASFSADIAKSPTTDPSPHTTHFSIIDRDRNIVAATLSINYPFGSGFTAASSGVLLNDEMDDFSIKPGHPNAYGLVGSHANAIAPGKRMLSSMTPTIVDDGHHLLVFGTSGGSRIITMVLLGILNFMQTSEICQIVEARRYHHQYLPDEVSLEPGALSPDIITKLQQMGHNIRQLDSLDGNMQGIIWNYANNTLSAAADPRGFGKALAK